MRRSIWIPASVAVVVIAVAAAAKQEAAQTPAAREPKAQIRVALKPDVLGLEETSEAEADRFRKAQLSLIRSDLVLLEALRRNNNRLKDLPPLRDEPNPAAWLAEHLKIGYVDDDSELLTLSLPGVDAQAAIQIVNTVAQTYLEEVQDKEQETQRGKVQTLKHELTARERMIASDKDQLHKLAPGTSGKRYDLRMAQFHELAEDQRQLARELRQLILSFNSETGDANQKKVREQLEQELAQLQSQRRELQEELDLLTVYNTEVEQLRGRVRRGESQLESLYAEVAQREMALKLPSRVSLWMMADVQ